MFALRRIPAMVSRPVLNHMAAPRPRAAMYASRARSSLFCAAGQRGTGHCKWFNVTKGYGFITPDDGTQDVFVHQTNIIADGFRSLAEGEQVEYIVETSDDGRAKAVEVSGPNGAPVQGAPAPQQQYGGGRNDGGYSDGGNYGGY
mmetsp:Transcript_9523/g.28648  ORF Transcript_9523/g.28648 Transcript_9523/m.28648 type:complete len:145 (-) Transcript_9523:730-1164(-)